VGIVLGSFTFDRVGYLRLFRLSFLLNAAAAFIFFLYLDNIAEVFVALAVVRGIPEGLYWAGHHAFYLKEVRGSARGSFLNIMTSIILLLSIIVPVLSGALISLRNDYDLIFILASAIYLLAAFFPWKYNKIPRSKLTMAEIIRITKLPKFSWIGQMSIFQSMVAAIFTVIFSIIPFILIRDEFGVGAFISIIAFFSAIFTFAERNMKEKIKTTIGMFGYILYAIFTVFFAVVWTIPALGIRSIAVIFSDGISTPVLDDINIRNKEKFLGDFKNESTLELNLVIETIFMITRVITLSIMFFIFQSSELDQIVIIRVLLIIFAGWKLIQLIWVRMMAKALKK
jgi:MFS family permease